MGKNSRAKASPAAEARTFNIAVTLEKGEGPKAALFKNRIVKVEGPVNAEMATNITTELMFLEAANPGAPITMLINSGGGSISDGWAIIDMMNAITSPVHTCVMGRAASMGATILMAGEKGHRSAMPNARIMIHEGTISGVDGQASDVSISAYEMESIRNRMLDFYSSCTGTSRKKLASLMTRDYFMYGPEAVEMGIVDNVVAFPDIKSSFNEVARKSSLEHQANRSMRPKPAP